MIRRLLFFAALVGWTSAVTDPLFAQPVPTRVPGPTPVPGPAPVAAPPSAARTPTSPPTMLKSKVLGENRAIFIRTPASYGRGAGRYPVLYLTDSDLQLGHTVSTAEFLARNNRIPELIIVGIANTDRIRDLTPTRSSMKTLNGSTREFPTSGGADRFLQFIETELIPHVEKNHRTLPYRIFAGHSFGGLLAFHALFSRPNLFNAIIAVSPSFPWDDRLMIRRGAEFFKKREELSRFLYFTMGNEGEQMVSGFQQMKSMLERVRPKSLLWDAKLMEDEDHGSIVLLSHYDGLRKVFEGWQLPMDPETGRAALGLDAADEHYRRLAARMGFPVKTPETFINQLGYQLLADGKADESIATFRTNTERYPQSPNTFDSLGEALEKSGRLQDARTSYERAWNLGQKTNDPSTAIFKANLDRVISSQRDRARTTASSN